MSEPESSTEHVRRHRVRKGYRSNRFVSSLAHVWHQWWVEILVVILIGVAIFLLFERMNIRQTLFTGLRRSVAWVSGLISAAVAGVAGLIRRTTVSDLIGYLLLVLVAALVVWRVRWRIMTSPRLTEMRCPQCGSELHRVHRRTRDRIVGLLVPVRRYGCRNASCGWRGLRVRQPHHES